MKGVWTQLKAIQCFSQGTFHGKKNAGICFVLIITMGRPGNPSIRSAKAWKQLNTFEERDFHFTFVLKFWCRKEAGQLRQIPQLSQPSAVWKAIDLTKLYETFSNYRELLFSDNIFAKSLAIALLKRRQAGYTICDILKATKVCWARSPGGKVPRLSFVCIQDSSIVKQYLSCCWSTLSTKNKIANTFVMDKLVQAECPLPERSGTFRRYRFCKN